MGVKIFSIVLILFAAELLFLSTKEPKKISISKEDINYTTIEFENLNAFKIQKDGVHDSLKASKALKYKNYSKLFDIDTKIKKDGLLHNISSKSATYTTDKITFTPNVKYENNNSITIKTDILTYLIDKKVASSDKPFELIGKNYRVSGDSFHYDIKDGKLDGKNIRYLQEVSR